MDLRSEDPNFYPSFYNTVSLDFDDLGRLYLIVRNVESVLRVEDGVVTAFAGVPTNLNHLPDPFDADGELASSVPLALDTTSSGHTSGFAVVDPWLYLPVFQQHVVLRVDLDSGVLQHIAGDPSALDRWEGLGPETPLPEEGAAALAADLYYPTDVAVGSDGAVYVLEAKRNCVRRFEVGGTITTYAGICGEVGEAEDGLSAVDAHLSGPTSIALDEQDNLYIAEQGTSSIRVVYAER